MGIATCPSCQGIIADDEINCRHCGANVRSIPPVMPAYSAPQKIQKPIYYDTMFPLRWMCFTFGLFGLFFMPILGIALLVTFLILVIASSILKSIHVNRR